jgi:hypothetical protein
MENKCENKCEKIGDKIRVTWEFPFPPGKSLTSSVMDFRVDDYEFKHANMYAMVKKLEPKIPAKFESMQSWFFPKKNTTSKIHRLDIVKIGGDVYLLAHDTIGNKLSTIAVSNLELNTWLKLMDYSREDRREIFRQIQTGSSSVTPVKIPRVNFNFKTSSIYSVIEKVLTEYDVRDLNSQTRWSMASRIRPNAIVGRRAIIVRWLGDDIHSPYNICGVGLSMLNPEDKWDARVGVENAILTKSMRTSLNHETCMAEFDKWAAKNGLTDGGGKR